MLLAITIITGIWDCIKYNFKKFKIGSAPLTKKRIICIDQLKTIRDCETPTQKTYLRYHFTNVE